MKLKWTGQAGFKIDNVLIDPWIDRVEAYGLDAPHSWSDEDKDAEVMIITHGHQDHISGAYPLAKEKGMIVVTSPEWSEEPRKLGCTLDTLWVGGPIKVRDWKVAFTQAVHAANTAGVILKRNGTTIYHAGDTGLFSDMKLIADLYKPDVALLPIGGRYTMDVKQAALAAKWIGAKIVIPMHYNTFPAIAADPQEFKTLVESTCNSKVVVLEVGEETEV